MDGNALAEGARVTYLKVFDDRPTRPRILNGRRAIGETTPTGLEPATPRFEV